MSCPVCSHVGMERGPAGIRRGIWWALCCISGWEPGVLSRKKLILIKTVRKTLCRTVAIGIKTRAIWERGQAELENNRRNGRFIA